MTAFNYRFVPAVRLARRADRRRRARRDPPLPRPLPPGVGLDRRRGLALRARRGRLRRARRPRRPRDRPRPLPRRRARRPCRRRPARSSPAARSTTPSRRSPSSRTARSGRSRRRASRPGRKNAFSWEINGSKGSLAFDLERLNELQHSDGTKGFRTILVSEADHPFWQWWWPHGHMIGWEHTFVHELRHLLDGDRRGHRRRPARCDLRGRLPRRRGLRRDPPLSRVRGARADHVPLSEPQSGRPQLTRPSGEPR